MATYLPGITDYIPQIQPFQPDWNFYQGALQFKQSRYDAAYEQVSNLYGSILNAPLSREDNANTRDEFFRVINQDIKKMAGLDLSKVQNLEAAKGLFNQILDDKHFKYDLMFTKNWMSEVQKGEALRECFDPEKCGGKYWDGGMDYLNFKRDEFRRAGRDESLTMDTGKYVAYQDVMGKAAKLAKEFGLEAEMDKIIGDYKVTYKNGYLIVNELNTLLHGALINDPAINDFYKVQSYNSRKNWAYSNAGNFESLDAAENAYIDNMYAQLAAQTGMTKEMTNALLEDLERKGNNLDNYFKENGTYQDDPLLAYAEQLNKAYQLVENSDKVYEIVSNQVESIPSSQSLRAKAAAFDASMAQMTLSKDITQIASALSKKGSSLKIAEAPFAALRKQQAFAKEQAELKFQRDLIRDGIKSSRDAVTNLYNKRKITDRDYILGLDNPELVLNKHLKKEEEKINGNTISQDFSVSGNAGESQEFTPLEIESQQQTLLKNTITTDAKGLLSSYSQMFKTLKSEKEQKLAIEDLASLLSSNINSKNKIKKDLNAALKQDGGFDNYLQTYLETSSDVVLLELVSNTAGLLQRDLAHLKSTNPTLGEFLEKNKSFIQSSEQNLKNLESYTQVSNDIKRKILSELNPAPHMREALSQVDPGISLPFAGKNGLLYDDKKQRVTKTEALEKIGSYYDLNFSNGFLYDDEKATKFLENAGINRKDLKWIKQKDIKKHVIESYYDKQIQKAAVAINKKYYNYAPTGEYGKNAINSYHNKVMMYTDIDFNSDNKPSLTLNSLLQDFQSLKLQNELVGTSTNPDKLIPEAITTIPEKHVKSYTNATLDFLRSYDKIIPGMNFSFSKNRSVQGHVVDYTKITFSDPNFRKELIDHLSKLNLGATDPKSYVGDFVDELYKHNRGLNIYTKPNSTKFHKSIEENSYKVSLMSTGEIAIPDNSRVNKDLKFIYDTKNKTVQLTGHILSYQDGTLKKLGVTDLGISKPIPIDMFDGTAMTDLFEILARLETKNNTDIKNARQE